MTHPAMRDYRTTPAPRVGENPALDALAVAVCQIGGHIPNRDRALPDSCDFHRRMAGGYLRVVASVDHGLPAPVMRLDGSTLDGHPMFPDSP